ncbi:MAG: branched-chain amino acid ABC transporter permease [Candidatus Latescibacterota bacterium]
MAGPWGRSRHRLGLGACAALVILMQVATALTETRYYLTQLTMGAYYCLVVLGLCLLMGYAGQISLGHAGFFAIGGYTTAVITTLNLADQAGRFPVSVLLQVGLAARATDLYGGSVVRLSPWLALMAAVLLALGVAYLIGTPVLRLRGHYLAMATLGFGTIIYRIVLGTGAFGEADGISDVPAFPLFPGLEISGRAPVRIANYYFAWGLVLALMVLFLNLVHSRLGRALRAVHSNEEAADAMGVDTARLKLRLFVISAVCAAVGGVFLTHYNGGIGPSEAGVMKSVRYVAIVAVGGMANLWGALAWGTLLSFLSLRGVFGSFDDAVFGGILVGVMLFAPEGLGRSGAGARAVDFLRRKLGDAAA